MKPPFDIAGDLDTPGIGVHEARRLRAALPARERRRGRAAGPLLLHRLRRWPGGEARSRRGHDRRERRPVPASSLELLAGTARRRCSWRRSRSRTSPACRWPVASSATSSYDVVRFFERLPAAGTRQRRSGAALRGASFAPGLRPPDPRHRAGARRLRGRAPLAAERSHPRACAERLPNDCAPGRYSPPTAAYSRARLPGRREAHAGVHRRRRCLPVGAVRRFAGRHELDPFQAYRALRLINPSPYMYYCALGDVTVVGSSPEALVKLERRSRAAAADRRYAPAFGRRRDRHCARGRAAR